MRKIAMVGTAPSGKHAPFTDKSWEIWGVGLRANYVTRAERWFELHRLDGEEKGWAADWRRLMSAWASECSIYMFYPEAIFPNVIKMDPAPLLAKYGSFFMTSSFAWMIAQALEEGVNEIGIWGVDMEYGTEYRQQRAGLQHFIHVARLVGVKTTLVASGGIAYQPVPYPFWQDDPMMAKVHLRKTFLKDNIKDVAFQLEKLQEKFLHAEGAAKLLTMMLDKNGVPFPDDVKATLRRQRDRTMEEAIDARRTMMQVRDDLRLLEGSLKENSWQEDYLQP